MQESTDASLPQWFGRIIAKNREYLTDKGLDFVPIFKLYK